MARILCYTGSMANLTLTIDDEVLKQARLRAIEQGTSVNAIVRAHLESFAGVDGAARGRQRVLELADASSSGSGGGGRRWTRDELHDRR